MDKNLMGSLIAQRRTNNEKFLKNVLLYNPFRSKITLSESMLQSLQKPLQMQLLQKWNCFFQQKHSELRS